MRSRDILSWCTMKKEAVWGETGGTKRKEGACGHNVSCEAQKHDGTCNSR